MTEKYNPKYLRHEPPKGQAAEDLEVFNLVKHNPTRKVDADKLPPIAMDTNGKVFFMDPVPALEDTLQEIWGLVMLTMGVLIGVFALVFVLATGTVNATILSWGTVGAAATFAIIKLKGEKKNVQH